MDWVVDSLKNRQSITVVDDQWNNPTWTVDLARRISRIIDHAIQGLYHYGGRDLLNRFAFAEMIAETFKLDRTLLEPIDTASTRADIFFRSLYVGDMTNVFMIKNIFRSVLFATAMLPHSDLFQFFRYTNHF